MYSSTNSLSCSKILGEVKVGLPKKHMKEFNNWFKDHVAASNVPNDDIKKLAAGPIFTVMTY